MTPHTQPEHLSPEHKRLLFEGLRQFNSKQFYLCHETLEELWMKEPGEIRELYQGILQVGVGYFHLIRYNHHGAVNLLELGVSKLAKFAPERLGINVAKLMSEAAASRQAIVGLGAERIKEFDIHIIPQIDFKR